LWVQERDAIIPIDRGQTRCLILGNKVMRTYELVMVLDPTLEEEQVEAIVGQVRAFVEGRDGEVLKVDRWGRRRLAYPIKRHRDGIYVLTQFRLDSGQANQLNRQLDLSEQVIRHLLVRADEDEE